MIRISIFLDSAWHDISGLYVPGSYTIQREAFNAERRSAVSSCAFRLRFQEELYRAITDSLDPIRIEIYQDEEMDFCGQLDPVADISWRKADLPSEISIECVDFSVKLDEYITQSASYPAAVDGPAFWIYSTENRSMSLLYRILEIAGLEDRIAEDAPEIRQQVKHMAWTKGEVTYRELIDALLADYLFVIMTDGDRITWVRTASADLKHLDTINPEDIIGTISKTRDYKTSNGAAVIWPKTKIMEDALLWRGNLPIGDTSDPRPGEYIASGDCWPEDSDIVETWQDFTADYLDTEYLEGNNRLRNDEIALISSSDWYLEDKKDASVVVDPVSETADIMYEGLRARLRYRNTGEEAARLYWSQIKGKALYKSHEITTSIPDGCTIPDNYETSYIYDKDAAERLAKGRYMLLRYGCFTIEFSSSRRFQPGETYELRQNPVYDGAIQIASRTESDGSGIISYLAYSTAAFQDLPAGSTGSQGSGAASPGQDGNSNRFIFCRAYSKPATPVGDNPAGWSLNVIPEGTAPAWMSTGVFSPTGNLIGSWTEPIRVQGKDAGAYRGAVDAFPADPADGDWILYTGTTTTDFKQYHLYKYIAVDNKWIETMESDKVMGAQYDALNIAKDTGEVIYAALLFVEILVARKLMVGGGTLSAGLLVRIMDDDGNGNCIIEARYNGTKVWWIDVETGKMYGNFAEVIQYLPFTFNDSLDPSHPATFDFYIPEGTVDWIKVSVQGQAYRSYNNGATTHTTLTALTNPAGNGTLFLSGATQAASLTVSSTGQTDMVGGGSIGPEGGSIPPHGHNVSVTGNATHGHSISISGNIPTHAHTVDIRHGHALDIGIIEGTTPTDMTISLKRLSGAWGVQESIVSGTERKYTVITEGGGWSGIRITSKTLGRIQVQVMLKMRIDTTLDQN